jgi:tRNA U34 5-methylaminomethyl-2-thiouridine-forming methyltransferase MnmC
VALESLGQETTPVDAWYLDGFAPSRNPDMWSVELMGEVFRLTVPGGRFGTYAAAGFVRRNLANAGFIVERRPGFAGKREMLCGQKPT